MRERRVESQYGIQVNVTVESDMYEMRYYMQKKL